MENMNFKVLNAKDKKDANVMQYVVQYLPYGITTLEMKIEEDAYGFIYPDNRSNGENNFHVGYADANEDFLVIWGGGKTKGVEVNSDNADGRLFLQVLHRGNTIDSRTISLKHSKQILPICKIKLEPAEQSDIVRMNMKQEGEYCIISFKGKKMPIYYSRWFPPRPLENKTIQYHDIEAPQVTIKFKAKKDEFTSNVDSDIDIFLENNKIAQVTGDWHYSWPHAELFTVFGDNEYLVLRFWLYWIHENYSKNIFLGGDALIEALRSSDDQTRRGLWESFDIECPDIERFDFLIDIRKRKITWLGTDFHYQELWCTFKDAEPVKAKIANDVETIVQTVTKLKNWLQNKEKKFDPMTRLEKILKGQVMEPNLEKLPDIKEYVVSNLDEKGKVTYRNVGFTRKHVPYAENGYIVDHLVSSVVYK